MKTITRASVMNFWVRALNKDSKGLIDDCREFNTTQMGEDAADHFDVMTDNGDSEIEREIFDWAVEFSRNHVTSEFN